MRALADGIVGGDSANGSDKHPAYWYVKCACDDCTKARTKLGDLIVCQKKVKELAKKHLEPHMKKSSEPAKKVNIVNPFAAQCYATARSLSLEELEDSERDRQDEKKITQATGHLLQDIIGELRGCVSNQASSDKEKTLPDIVCEKRRIIAEIKSASNTENKSGKKGTHATLTEFLADPKYDGYMAIVVDLLYTAKSRTSWRPYGTKNEHNPKILLMGGRAFCAFMTGPLTEPQPKGLEEEPDFLFNNGLFNPDALHQLIYQQFEAIAELTGQPTLDELKKAVPVKYKS